MRFALDHLDGRVTGGVHRFTQLARSIQKPRSHIFGHMTWRARFRLLERMIRVQECLGLALGISGFDQVGQVRLQEDLEGHPDRIVTKPRNVPFVKLWILGRYVPVVLRFVVPVSGNRLQLVELEQRHPLRVLFFTGFPDRRGRCRPDTWRCSAGA